MADHLSNIPQLWQGNLRTGRKTTNKQPDNEQKRTHSYDPRERKKARKYLKFVFSPLKVLAAEEWPWWWWCRKSFVCPWRTSYIHHIQNPISRAWVSGLIWMQGEVNFNVGVVITASLLRCDNIPELRAAVCMNPLYQNDEKQISCILAGNLHVKHWRKHLAGW